MLTNCREESEIGRVDAESSVTSALVKDIRVRILSSKGNQIRRVLTGRNKTGQAG